MQVLTFVIVLLSVSLKSECQLLQFLGDRVHDAVKKVHNGIHNGFDVNIQAHVGPILPGIHLTQPQHQQQPNFQGNQNFNRPPNYQYNQQPAPQPHPRPQNPDKTIIVIVEQVPGNDRPVQNQPHQINHQQPPPNYNNFGPTDPPKKHEYGTINNGDKKDEPTHVDFNLNQYDFAKDKTSTSSPKREVSDATPVKEDGEEDFDLDERFGKK